MLAAVRRNEVLVALLASGALALATYGAHVIRGGWYYDDWDFVAQLDLARSGGLDSVWRASQDISYRPLFCVVFLFMYLVGGTGQAAYLLFGVAATGAQGWLLYLVLRRLGVARHVAAAGGVMLIVVPAVDAARLWAAAIPSSISVAGYLAGVLCALRGLEATGRRAAVVRHAGAVALYAAAAFTSELVIPLIALAPALYAIHAGRRRAVARAPADLALAAVALLYMAGAASDARPANGSLSYLVDRAGQVLSAGVPVLRDQLPLDGVLWGPLGLVVLCGAAVGIAGAGRLRATRGELALAACGFVFMVAGVVMLLPAEPYYVPRATGVGDRLAIAAAPGFAAFAAGLIAFVARGVSALARRPGARLPLFAGMAFVTATTMLAAEVRAQSPWARSWKDAQNVVSAVRHSLPEVPHGASIVTFRHPTLLPGDAPVFLSPNDLQGALRLAYRDETIVARPFIAGTLHCQPGALRLASMPGGGGVARPPYGDLYFVDVPTYTAREIGGPPECASELARLGGP